MGNPDHGLLKRRPHKGFSVAANAGRRPDEWKAG